MSDSGIFKAAVKLPPERRADYLDQVCGANHELRREVESLLQAHDQPGSFLQSRLPATAGEPPISERPGTVIGPYKLLQQIGEGGMGVVYMAEQLEPVRRKVALKIIKPGMDSKQVIARFEAERQALAMMDHQNIARVLDAGTTESGRPYFVMELVHGVPITQFCDENKLTPRERLALFVPVCQAIQHAHQKGIIHRDVKPSNVLVTMYDDKPVPKVIDFGVTKAIEQRLTEKSMFTQFGALIGTFEYMSPEQAEMNAFGVDTRSDIYSLGVLLYELLTGTTPLERARLREAALGEMVRLIKEEEAPRPSVRLSSSGTLAKIAAARKTEPAKLSKLVRGDIDWIVMKCLEKDRARRYVTANAVARDLERYLADEPVEACPPSLTYKLGKLVRRNRSAVLTTASLALVLLLGVGAVAAVQLRAIRDRAAVAADRAVREAGTTASVTEALRDAREREGEAWNLYDYPERMQQVTDEATSAIRRAEGFVASGTSTDSTLSELAAARHDVDELVRHTRLITACNANQLRFADELNGQNVAMTATRLCQSQAEVLKQFGMDPLNDNPDKIAQSIASNRLRDAILGMLLEWHWWVGSLLEGRYAIKEGGASRPDQTVKARLYQVIRSTRQMCGGAYSQWQDLLDRNDVPGLVAFAKTTEGLSFRSNVVGALGRDLNDAKEFVVYRDLLRAAVDRYPLDIWLRSDLAVACTTASAPNFHESLCHTSALCTLRPESALFHLRLGNGYRLTGNPDLALAAYKKSLALYPKSALAYSAIGDVLLDKKELDGAIAAFREAIRLGPNQTNGHRRLAFTLGAAKRYSESLEVAVTALREHPAWADDPHNFLRYNAACAAVRCASDNVGSVASPAEQAKYRKQAMDFLVDDLAAYHKLLNTEPAFVSRQVQHWLVDEDLKGVREVELPMHERYAWEKFWDDVRDLAKQEPGSRPQDKR